MDANITIIGGGIAGLTSALLLAQEGYHTHIYENKDFVLKGSSEATPCRLGLGFHYPDEQTALQYLHTTINLVRKRPGIIISEGNRKAEHLRRCRYFVVKDSQFSKESILSIWNKLREEYARLVKDDPQNAIFGSPEKFFTFLNPNEYQDEVNSSIVEFAVETAESFINWPKFKQDLINDVFNHPNIHISTNSEVIDAKANKNGSYRLTIRNNLSDEINTIMAPFVINASWQNIEAINMKAGIEVLPQHMPTHRTKAMLGVKLPKELLGSHSMFFCFGPHASFTNLGNGNGYITYEPVTNLTCEHGPFLSSESMRYLDNRLDLAEKQDLAQRMIAGVTKYIPAMKNAKYDTFKFGAVKTFGYCDLNDPNSSHHKRVESGVRVQKSKWVDNASMKLVKCFDNAEEIVKIVKNNYPLEQHFEEHLQENTFVNIPTYCNIPCHENISAKHSGRIAYLKLRSKSASMKKQKAILAV